MTAPTNLQILHQQEISLEDLQKARRTLLQVAEFPEHKLAAAAFRFGLMEYARPFKTSNIPDGAGGKTGVKILRDLVPKDLRDLHDKIIALRDGFLAHSDATFRDSDLEVVEISGCRIPFRAEMTVSGTELLSEITNIIRLTEAIIEVLINENEKLLLIVSPHAIMGATAS